MTDRFDLIILDSGSTAFAAELRAAGLGRTAVMTESRMLGGTCVNCGCLPSKDLIEAAAMFWEAQHPRYPGLSAAPMRLDFRKLVQQKDDVIHDYRDSKYGSIVVSAEKTTEGVTIGWDSSEYVHSRKTPFPSEAKRLRITKTTRKSGVDNCCSAL